MRIKFKPWAKEYIEKNKNIFIQDENDLKNKVAKYDNFILEIGCGKGQYSIQKAKTTDALYVALERNESVIVSAGEKKINDFVDNLYFYATDINTLKEFAWLENKIDAIILNFSDPWPKKRHAKRRLTAPSYLDIYKFLLKKDGKIYLKTDNQNLFEFSIMSFNNCNWRIEALCLDLHNSDRDNILTEYEEKFSKKGFKIYYGEFSPKE